MILLLIFLDRLSALKLLIRYCELYGLLTNIKDDPDDLRTTEDYFMINEIVNMGCVRYSYSLFTRLRSENNVLKGWEDELSASACPIIAGMVGRYIRNTTGYIVSF
jgi:hypothetical protein